MRLKHNINMSLLFNLKKGYGKNAIPARKKQIFIRGIMRRKL